MLTFDPALFDLLETGRRIAVKQAPAYYRGALWSLSFVPCDDVPTFAVDNRWRCYVNPAFAKKEAGRSMHGLAAIIVHEALHPTFRHEARSKACLVDDYDAWNKAGDCEINLVIDRTALKLPPEGLRPRMFGWPDDESAEGYYARFKHNHGKSDSTCAGGSGAGGKPGPWEGAAEEARAQGARVPAGLSEAQGQGVRIRVARAAQEAETAKPGSVPGGVLRWANELLAAPVIPWETLLAASLRSNVLSRRGATPSYARPSRRLSTGLMLPVHRAPVPKITIVGDTSASMGAKDIARILAVVRDACLSIGKAWVVPCDARASEPVEVLSLEDLEPYFAGGGGTDMRVGIKRAEEMTPDAILVVTDCETQWPGQKPDAPMMVVSTRRGSYERAVPSWATLIQAN